MGLAKGEGWGLTLTFHVRRGAFQLHETAMAQAASRASLSIPAPHPHFKLSHAGAALGSPTLLELLTTRPPALAP